MRLLLPCAMIFIAGCGPTEFASVATSDGAGSPAKNANPPGLAQANSDTLGVRYAESARYGGNGMSAVADQIPDVATSTENFPAERRIIYAATLEMAVSTFEGLESKVNSLVSAHGGYVASANLDRMQGERRSGLWVLRIPVQRYESFLESVGNIGVPTSRVQSANDVSEQFVDMEARLTNKRKLEGRIRQLLERPDDKIQHVIEVERELGRVREEIERIEGQLRYLADKTSMTTVTLQVREEREYTPPQAPTFANRIVAAWSGSFRNVAAFLEHITVVAAGAVLPLTLIGVVVWTFWKLVRRRLSKAAATRAV